MSELAETVSETLGHSDHDRLNSMIAVLVAVAATFMALCNVKDGNVVQNMAQDQAKQVDAWSYYQAKSTKENIAESMIDQLSVQRALATGPEARALVDEKLAAYKAAVARYQKEKSDIKAEAEGYQSDFDRLNIRDDQLDMAEALLSVALALFGITALTRKRVLFGFAAAFAGIGVFLGIAAFAGLKVHPDFLARLLG
jgi:glucose/arabinose dehydrogenase